MEVATTATAIRHPLTALAALALILAFAGTAVSAGERQTKQRVIGGNVLDKPTFGEKMRVQHYQDELVTGTKGLTTKKGSRH
jgi:hypothetical protein